MNLNHLTDNELIQYTIKYDDDTVRVRLATIMERMPGCILDSLIDAGMDPDYCTFENTWDAGQYIRHLENEIEFLNNELHQAQEEVISLRARTIIDFVAEVKSQLTKAENNEREYRRQYEVEVMRRKEAEDKWEMWDKLHHGIRS